MDSKNGDRKITVQELLKHLRDLGVGRRHFYTTLEKCSCKDRIQALVDGFADKSNRGRGIVFAGAVGTGKTAAMIVLMKMLLMKYSVAEEQIDHDLQERREIRDWIIEYLPVCKFLKATRLYRMIRRFEDTQIEGLKDTDCLFIDDFGSQSNTDYAFSEFEELIDYRYENYLPTFITTNISKERMSESDGFKRILDRWRECMDLVYVNGESMRVKA